MKATLKEIAKLALFGLAATLLIKIMLI